MTTTIRSRKVRRILRLEGGRLSAFVSRDVYKLTETLTQWIGARVEDVRLLLTVEARGADYEVGGVLMHLSGLERIARDVAPLLPKQIERKARTKPASEPPATRDAGTPARDAAPVAPRDL